MRCREFVCSTIAIALSLVSTCLVLADDWPQWRGPQRDNCSRETGLLQQWPDGGPPLLWRADGIGTGIASVSVVQGRVYTVGYVDQDEYAWALDAASGKPIWHTRLGEAVQENALMRWLSQRSPTVDGDHIYFVRADGDLICLQTNDGIELWRKSYSRDFGAGRPLWGYCDFPLVDHDRLIIAPGSPDIGIAALNKLTGDVVWKTIVPGVTRTGHAATVVATIAGARQYLIYSDLGLFGVRAEDGKILWQYDKLRFRFGNSHTPIVRDDLIFSISSSGEVAGIRVLGKESGFEVEQLYLQSSMNLDPFHDCCTFVDGHIFGFRRGGMPLCYAAKTGEISWGPLRPQSIQPPTTAAGRANRPRRAGQGAMTYADGRLYLRFSDGAMTLTEANAHEYVERGKFVIPDHRDGLGSTLPVISGGRMYLRDDDHLFCYEVRADAERPEPRLVQLTAPPSASAARSASPTRTGPEARGRAETRLAADAGESRSVFVPTPHDVVAKMLQLAEVQQDDLLIDLGSGDGRIVIGAAKTYGCRAIGYEIDAELVEISRKNAQREGVSQQATFEQRDVFTVDLSTADVVAVYLLPKQLEQLLPQLEKLKSGARIVSHQFPLAGFTPDKEVEVVSREDGERHKVMLWTVPLKKSAE